MATNRYSPNSQKNLDSCHSELQELFRDVLKVADHSIICGHRTQADQFALFNEGKSKVRLSKHNAIPSRAVDVIPYPIKDNWDDDRDKIIVFSKLVLAIAEYKGIAIRWGGDWDGDGDMTDQTFNDFVHYELKNDSPQNIFQALKPDLKKETTTEPIHGDGQAGKRR